MELCQYVLLIQSVKLYARLNLYWCNSWTALCRGLNRLVLCEAIGTLVGLNGTGAGSIDSLVKSSISAEVGSISAGGKSIVTLTEANLCEIGSIGVLIGVRYSIGLVGAGVGSIGALVFYSRSFTSVVSIFTKLYRP